MPTTVALTCARGLGEKKAAAISDTSITDSQAGLLRGKRFLDDPSLGGYYYVTKQTLKVPHKYADLLPTKWVSITNDRLELSEQLFKVKEYDITITPSSIWGTLVVERYSTGI